MTNFFSPLSPKSKAKNKTKVIAKNKAKNRSRNDADNTTKSRNIQKTVVNVIVPDHDSKNKHHQDCRRFW
ncbi:hypothetical protein MH215_15515 [Paenibacillus sp. ACRSA]|uniref:hypothetical protein n=1 Tax=Paenibacillus sp. ACRSA TaxID=2918211 RepID=UPI001EF52C59|nr:hypothetical protein [Paenibacillus sp. ACRSA]MCG7378412.1 hypothetical protein [Paenibacillus sp. ACRSA]